MIEILKRRNANLRNDERVFPISAATYAKWWRAALKHVLGSADLRGPPHSARHTGASKDLATGYRTFAQVQRRGRWKTQVAVQRYARPHVWMAAEASVPKDVLDKGNALLSERPPRPKVPM